MTQTGMVVFLSKFVVEVCFLCTHFVHVMKDSNQLFSFNQGTFAEEFKFPYTKVCKWELTEIDALDENKKAVLGLVCFVADEDCGSKNQWSDIKSRISLK